MMSIRISTTRSARSPVVRRVVLVVLLTAATLMGGCAGGGQPRAPSPSATTQITMPDVVGQNADVALDTLHRLGLRNVDLGTVDGRQVVILPQNWVVSAQSAKPGSHPAADAKVVLGCTRIGGHRWPMPGGSGP